MEGVILLYILVLVILQLIELLDQPTELPLLRRITLLELGVLLQHHLIFILELLEDVA